MRFFVTLLPDALELVEVILHEGKQVGGSRITRAIDSLGRAWHIGSNLWTDSMANIVLGAGTRKGGRASEQITVHGGGPAIQSGETHVELQASRAQSQLDPRVWAPGRIAILFDHRVPAESPKSATNPTGASSWQGNAYLNKTALVPDLILY